jgi:hypothetical protein
MRTLPPLDFHELMQMMEFVACLEYACEKNSDPARDLSRFMTMMSLGGQSIEQRKLGMEQIAQDYRIPPLPDEALQHMRVASLTTTANSLMTRPARPSHHAVFFIMNDPADNRPFVSGLIMGVQSALPMSVGFYAGVDDLTRPQVEQEWIRNLASSYDDSLKRRTYSQGPVLKLL